MNGDKGNKMAAIPEERDRHKKPGKQVSDSKKRSDHKHVYEDSISVLFNCYDGHVSNIFPSKHCSICGRYQSTGGFFWRNENHKYEVMLPHGRYRFMTIAELKEKYPTVPLYTNGLEKNHIDIDIRIG